MRPKIRINTFSPQETLELKYKKQEQKNRILTQTGSMHQEEAASLILALKSMAMESDEPIYLYLYNTSCNLSDGLALYDTIRMLSCDVYTIGYGFLNSIASLLIASGSQGKRYLAPNTECILGYPDDSPTLLMSTYRLCREHKDEHLEKLATLLSLRTDKSPDEIKYHMEHNQNLSSSAALRYGIADCIGDPILRPGSMTDMENIKEPMLSRRRNIGTMFHNERNRRDTNYKTNLNETAKELLNPDPNHSYDDLND